MRVLVTGGAGYIGRHVVTLLEARGDEVVVVDDLSAPGAKPPSVAKLVRLDLAGHSAARTLARTLIDEAVDAVVHLAARKKVDESVARPLWYFEQNVGGVLAVLAAMNEAGVRRLLFSSTAAVYGDSSTRVAESSVTAPSNPYGESKLVGEWMIRDQSVLGMLRATSLRYFNVLGAASPEFGDLSESNIVPMVYERIERGEQPVIFGDGYPTLDGTCVRDYVHVVDVAMAHLVALDELADPAGTPYQVFNVGTGQGASVRELIERMILIAGSHIEPRVAPPRPGDPASVVADPSRIHDELGWQATFDLDQMLESAWAARLARQGN